LVYGEANGCPRQKRAAELIARLAKEMDATVASLQLRAAAH
jgi:hypothetical protein